MSWLLALLLVCQQPAPMPPVTDTVPNKVAGLELPADLTVPSDESFIEIDASTTGEVRWYVLGTTPVKFRSLGKSIIVATPAKGGQVVILAVALVDNKLTEFARCNLTVTAVGPSPPNPPPPPSPPPTPVVKGKLFIVIVEDPTQRTQVSARVIESQALRTLAGADEKGRPFLRVVANNDLFLKNANLTSAILQAGPLPVIIAQDETGKVVLSRSLPATETEALQLLKQLKGQP